MKIETFFMLMLAFVINIFAVVIFANFSSTADPDNVGLESAGGMISETYGDTVSGWLRDDWSSLMGTLLVVGCRALLVVGDTVRCWL